MKNLKIGMRMGIGYAIVLVLLAAIAWLGINRMGQMHAHLEQIATVDNTVSTLARDMRMTVDDRMIEVGARDLLRALASRACEQRLDGGELFVGQREPEAFLAADRRRRPRARMIDEVSADGGHLRVIVTSA